MSNGNKKNAIFVDDNAVNKSAKFRLYPPYSFWEDEFLLYVFSNLGFRFKFRGLDMNDNTFGVNIPVKSTP